MTANERISSGFEVIDEVLDGGLRRGVVTAVAGRPTMGKTSLAFNVAVQAASSGQLVVIGSLGESPGDARARLMTLVTEGAPAPRVLDGIETLDDPRSAIGADVDLIVVDGLDTAADLDFDLWAAVAADQLPVWSTLAADLGCAVLVLSRVAPDGESRPTLAGLPECVAFDAGAVLLVHQTDRIDSASPIAEVSSVEVIAAWDGAVQHRRPAALEFVSGELRFRTSPSATS